jgi:hypothetical protein
LDVFLGFALPLTFFGAGGGATPAGVAGGGITEAGAGAGAGVDAAADAETDPLDDFSGADIEEVALEAGSLLEYVNAK